MIRGARLSWLKTTQAAIAFSILLSTSIGCSRSHAPTKMDDFLMNVAVEFQEPGICEKINPDSIGGEAGFGTPGHQISLMKSDCYYDLAVRMNDLSLCDKVRPISERFLNGSDENPSQCRKELNGRNIDVFPIYHDAFVSRMQSLGYILPTENRQSWQIFEDYHRLFLQLAREKKESLARNEFLDKVRNLPN